MIVSINQPRYMPWVGYFHRIAVSDLFIYLDTAAFAPCDWENRNRVKTTQGWTWLTVPMQRRPQGKRPQLSAAKIDNSRPWRRKHWDTLCQLYGSAPHFAEHRPFFEDLYARDWDRLIDLCLHMNQYVLGVLGIDSPTVCASEFNVAGAKDDHLLNLCGACDAGVYLSGPLGRDYLREEIFRGAGIEVRYHDYEHPRYPQARGQAFEPFMGVVDLLFNHGRDSRAIMMGVSEVSEASEVSKPSRVSKASRACTS